MKIEEALQIKSFPSEVARAHVNMLFTASWLKHRISCRLRPYGLTHEQFNVLRILRGQYPESINQKGILSRMIDRNSNVTRIIAKLKKRKWVQVERSSTDGRAYEIVITEAGLELLAQLDRDQILLEPPVSGLTEQEAALLSALLDKMRSNG